MRLIATNSPATVGRQRRLTLAQCILLVTVLVVVVTVLVVWLRAPADPLYKGKLLSAYLYDTVPGAQANSLPPPRTPAFFQDLDRRRAEAREATVAIGPKAIPLIRQWLKPKSRLNLRLRKLALTPGSRFGWLLKFNWLTKDQGNLALNAASFIPAHGAPLVPILRERVLSDETPMAVKAAFLLGQILDSIPPD